MAGGCFWCTEAIFRRLDGVLRVTNGYTGGTIDNPSYEQVCSGTTGHAEAIEVEFNERTINYEDIVTIFMNLHDPTTKNQQGADIGTQYRSVIFYHDNSQRQIAEKIVNNTSGAITEVVAAGKFYPAEIEHQQYYEINNQAPYCQVVIKPKINKLISKYHAKIKTGYLD